MKKTCTYLSKKKTHLFAMAFLLFSLTGFAQTHYYVAPAGNNANNGLSPATAKLTLQHTVSIAADGSIINLANGTYTLTATLNFNRELSIVGESEAGVIINATGTPASAWALNPNRSNTSLSNFTLVPNGSAGGFPIHVGANSGPPLPVISNVSLSHITINGAKKTAFDFNGVNNLTLDHLTATNTSAGNGIQLSGCWNVNASNIITSGNVWGGLAVYVSKPYPSGVGRGSSNINIDASNSSFAEVQAIYNQDESGFFNTNIAVNGYDYAVQNTTAVGYTYYFNNKTTALAFAAALPNPGTSSVKQISTAQYVAGAGMKIQAAVNAAAVNSVVNIEAGTYHEDVTINKQLTLQGAGMNNTIVSGAVGGGGATFQISANGVVIDGFTITRDGNTVAAWNDPGLNFAGIAIQTAGNAEIRNCKFIGNRTAIDVNNSNGNNIHNNIITGNRSGLLFRNKTDQTTVTENFITNNWTIGVLFLDASGGTNVPVQSAANSTFSNNDISGNWYGQIADRQTGGALPAAGNNLKNFSCNWYGSIAPVASVNNTTEPGYAAQVPVAYGGSAVAPGGQPDIAGSGSVNIIFQPYLANGSDNDAEAPGFQPAPNSCRNPLSNAQVTSITHILCHGGATGSATVSFENGIGAVTYSVDGSASVSVAASPFTISGLTAGAHNITVTDGAGNNAAVHVVVTEPAAALTANFTFTPIVCNGGLSTQNITINGGTAPYTVLNQGGGAFVIGASEGVTYGGTEGNTYAANYVYTVTDANGCQYVFEASITQPDVLIVSSSATPITCGGNSAVTVIATGGKAPYTGTGTFNVTAGTYVYTVTDANGCSSTTTITPDVVADTEKPTVTAPHTYSMVNDPGQCGRIINFIGTPVTGDNCGVASITNDHPSNFYPVGTTIVKWIVTDLSGNVNDTATQKVIVMDNEMPLIQVTNTSVNNTTGACGANITLALPVVSDNCGVAGVTNNHPSTFFPVGTTNVTWTVTDNNGWAETAIQRVTVTDTEKPTVTAQPLTVYLNAAGIATITAAQLHVTGTDNCDIASYNLSKTSFNCSNIGVNTITVTATDVNGNIQTATAVVTVKDNLQPIIVPVANQTFCNNGTYSLPVLTATDNCSTVSISYTITGATTRNGNTSNASGIFNTGVSTISWTAKDASGNTSYGSTTVTVTALPAATITVSNADAFCNKLTLTANSGVSGASYKWTSGSSVFATTQQVSLGQSNGDGVYNVTVTSGGCTSAPASYHYQKQNLVSSYTILAFDDINLGTNNIVASGSIGVTSGSGEIDLHSNSSVSSPGSFVKAKRIDKNGSNISIANPIYSAATGITLPAMLLNTANTNNLPNKDVAQNSVATVNGNYKNLTLKKGSRTTITGNTFGTIRVEQGAQVTFTAATINIDKLQVVKGPRYGYSYVRFAGDAKILVSASVSIGSQVYINPDNRNVTFYMGDKKSDEEKFAVNGGDTKVTANIYVPNGKLKVTGGYSYGNYGNGFGDCDRDDEDERYYGLGSSYVNMTGLFIAEEVEGNGKNVIWNSFDCNAAPVPVLNAVITQMTAATKETVTSEEELKVTVLPNPSTTYFTLKIESKYATPVNLRVIDSRGRVVDARSGIGSNSTIQVGHAYSGGTYYAEMVQGGSRKVVQLIKLR